MNLFKQLISCLVGGHVYHFDCLQSMFESNWTQGVVSCCSICRKEIKDKKLNRVYGTYPKDKMFYEVLLPNIGGKKVSRPPTFTTAPVTSDYASNYDDDDDDEEGDDYDEEENDFDDDEDDNSDLIEYQEDRIADLERQLANASRYQVAFRNLENEFRRTSADLYVVRRELNDRNLKIEGLIKEKLEQRKEIDTLKIDLNTAKEELESFRNFKMAIEVVRLAKYISVMQKEAYFNNLLKDLSTTRADLIGMIVGYDQINKENDVEKSELLKENRKLRIEKENLDKRIRLNDQQLKLLQKQQQTPVLKPKPATYDEASETELDEPDECFEDNKENFPTFVNPFAVNPSQSSNKPSVSRMVPSSIPKGLALPKSSNSVPTGTGKRQKVLQFGQGGNTFI